jgi:ubiquinone/menaquinone biosynthesis C-methylase UbiE
MKGLQPVGDGISGSAASSSSAFAPASNPLERVGQLIVGYRGAKVLLAAVELDLFRALDATDGRLPALSRRTGFLLHHLEVLLDALVALGFLEKSAGRYSNTTFSREWLHPDGAHSLVNILRFQELLSQPYAELVSAIRTGGPRQNLGDLLTQRPNFVEPYIGSMAEISQRPAKELVGALNIAGARDLLDVGGGPGVYCRACLEKNAVLRGVILDVPETLKIARRLIGNGPLAERITLKEGDYHNDDFGRSCYDLVLMSHITHDESPDDNQALLRKAHAALRPGGRVVVHDFMTKDDGTAPLFSVLFSVHMLTFTKAGRVYSEADYSAWLKGAGFQIVQRVDVGSDAPGSTVALAAMKMER